MSKSRAFLYKVLTLFIILLGRLRFCVAGGRYGAWELRKDRDEQNLMPQMWFSKARGILLECCDCGLSHRLFESERGAHAWPERPKGYNYKWRLGS